MKKILLILLLAFLYNKSHSLVGFEPAQEKAIKQYIEAFSKQNHIPKSELEAAFKKVKLQKSTISSISHPHEALPWFKYRKLFVTSTRIKEGVAFWKKHQAALKRAEKQYGVPQEVIVALIGIETKYGKHQGKHHVIDALTTLGFAYSPRAKFFKKELGQFLLLCREQKFTAYDILGSYAGAIGQPQFMPSSYRHYAVDFDHSGKADLIHSTTDAIGSVGNYLKENGWKKDRPLIYKANVLNTKYKKLKQKSNRPQFSARALARHGVKTNKKLPKRQKFVWLELDTAPHQQGHWVGSHNFYVITRYNTSKLYAMAAVELSQAIKAEFNKTHRA